MELSSTTQQNMRIVSVAESRIDAAVAIEFKDAMRVQTDDAPNLIILDLSKVEFIDSSGLGAIVAAMKQLGGSRRLDLAGLTPMVEKVFRLTRMDTIFDLYSSLSEATAPASANS